MSDAAPSSIPEAAARFRTPGRPAADCCADHPARDMYFSASADCVAVNIVDAPYSRAVSCSMAYSCPVAPEMAATSAIICVYSVPSPILSCTKSLNPFAILMAPMARAIFLMVSPRLKALPDVASISAPAVLASFPSPSRPLLSPIPLALSPRPSAADAA